MACVNALTKTESSELAQHERTIQQGLATFRDVGAALMAIRDGKLYRADYGTFEVYCQHKWGWSRQRANYLIAATETAAVVDNHGYQKPTSERQVRPLAKLPAESRAEAWEEAVERAPKVNGTPKVTAKLVEEVVAEHLAEPFEDEPRKLFDYLNKEVPENAHAAFDNESHSDARRTRWRWCRSPPGA